MDLSAELFAEIINANEPAAAPKGVVEKRRADRIPMRFAAQLRLESTGGAGLTVGTMIRDFSQRGFCIEHPERMPPGTQFVLMLPGRSGTLSLLCSVAHSKPSRGSTGFYIGGEFVCTLQAPDADREAAELDRIRKSIF